MSVHPGRWNDDRLDEMNRRLIQVEPVVTDVAVIKTEMRSLRGALDANTQATKAVANQMEKAQLEPLTRARNFRNALFIALAAAVMGGLMTVLGAAIAGAH